MRFLAFAAFSLSAILLARPTQGQTTGSGYYEPELTAQDREHWSFKLPTRRPPPTVKAVALVRNPIDSFILTRLEASGLALAPEADRRTLIRRATFDLTGLPPTPAEIDSFLADPSPDAYPRLIERLLASPHYGERWAQHWLDVVRFAESNGYEADAERPQAWRYRDYVIRNLNADKPYDRFLAEQVAGDELAEARDPKACADLFVATGVHRCGPAHMVGGNVEKEIVRQELVTEMVNGLGSAVLGMTIACARCHDHKFDPVSQADYYRLQAFFAAAEYAEVDLATAAEREAHKAKLAAVNAHTAPLKKEIAALDGPAREVVRRRKREAFEPTLRQALETPPEKQTPEQKRLAATTITLLKVTWDETLAAMSPADRTHRAELRARLHDWEAQLPPPTAAGWAIRNAATVPVTHILKRGEVARKTAVVTPNVPRILNPAKSEPKTRTELARWLTSPANPLTARVIVNRLWQHHFGRGIVATPNDFGTRGERPTHPELLDWLACELVSPSSGGESETPTPWSLKHIHRLMVMSAAYRQASDIPASDVAKKVDPENKLLWRMNRRRLEAETIRDAVLAAAGTLNREVGGRSVKVPLEPEVYDLIFTEGERDGLWPVTPDPKQHARRSIYLLNKRNVRQPMLESFDQPDTLTSCANRPVSTFAPQALILMNGPFVQAQGKALACRLVGKFGSDNAQSIEALYVRSVGRKPTAAEQRLATEFLTTQTDLVRDRIRARLPVGLPADLPTNADPARARALADLCAALFNTNEFVYIP